MLACNYNRPTSLLVTFKKLCNFFFFFLNSIDSNVNFTPSPFVCVCVCVCALLSTLCEARTDQATCLE